MFYEEGGETLTPIPAKIQGQIGALSKFISLAQG